MKRTAILALASLSVLFPGNNGGSGPARAEENTAQEWSVYNGGPEGRHYSPLAQINRENVNRLEVAWTFDSGDAFPGSEMECNPIVVNGVLYATTPKVNGSSPVLPAG